MYHAVARQEGVFCEPSSAAGIAGLRKAIALGSLDPRDQRIVCVLTGHGLKDPDSAFSGISLPPPIPATIEDLLNAVGLG
jgi:threonine synthase